jgi:hypothetical protein
LHTNRGRGADAVCLLALLGFACAVAAPVFLGGVPVAMDTLALWGPQAVTAPQPVHNPDLADSALIFLPWQVFVRRSLAGGEWPLWNPDVFAGYPFQGNPQTQLYYPLMWLLWLLPLPQALQLGEIVHLWLAGAGMFVLARVLSTSRTGSVLAGLTFAGCGQLYMVLVYPGQAYIFPWLPWVVAAAEIAWRRRSWAWAAGAGGLFGVLALAGHLQWFLYSAMFLAAWLAGHLGYAAWTAWRHPTPGAGRAWAGQAARAGAILAWGPALAAVQLFPFVELSRLSTRISDAGAAVGPDDPARTLRLLARQLHLFVPQLFGNSVGQVGNPLGFNNCWYVGLAPLALALVALAVRRERRVWFLGALGLAAFAAAAGLPLFNRVQQLPGLQALIPLRIAYLFMFCVAALAGLGFDAWLELARRRVGAALALLSAFVLAAAGIIYLLADRHAQSASNPALYHLQTEAFRQAALIAGALGLWALATLALRGNRQRGRRAVLAGGLLGLTAVDLLTYAPNYNTYVAPAALQPQHPAADVMHEGPGGGRMMAPDAPGATFPPSEAVLYGLHDVQGYDSLHLARYEAYWAAGEPALGTGTQANYFNVMMRPQNYTSTLADLLNVVYVTTWAPLPSVPAKLEPLYTTGVGVYRNRAALPRAFVADGAEVLAAEAIPARVAAPGFDPRRAVLLEQAPPAGFPATPGDPTPPGTATITRYRNLSVEVAARMDRPGWLVLGDVNYPGWRVTVDGQPAPLYTADGLLRAVPLAAGTHTVRFAFQPLSVLLGAGVSAGALLLVLGVLGAAAVRRRRTERGGTL